MAVEVQGNALAKAVENTPTTTESMVSFLAERRGEKAPTSEGSGGTEDADNAEPTGEQEGDDKKPEDQEEGEKEEGQKEATEKKEEKPQSKDEKQKENRYQRLKRKTDTLQAEVDQHVETRDRAVYQANVWRNRFLTLQDEVNTMLASKGVNLSKTEIENVNLKLKGVESDLSGPVSEQAKKRQADKEVRQYVESQSEKYVDEATNLSEKYGVDAAEILETFAVMQAKGHTMERVAKILRADAVTDGKIKPAPTPAKKKPPVPLRTAGSGTRVEFPATEKGMADYLEMKRKASGKK